jgi:hypothetical protein
MLEPFWFAAAADVDDDAALNALVTARSSATTATAASPDLLR